MSPVPIVGTGGTGRTPRTSGRKALSGSTLWLGALAGLSALVILALTAFDVLALLVLGAVLFAVERTVGDWLTDALGPLVAKMVFVGGVVVAGGTLLTFSPVRNGIWSVLQSADEAGLHSALVEYLSVVPSVMPATVDGGGGSGQTAPRNPSNPVLSGGDSRRSRSSDTAGEPAHTRLILRLRGQGSTVLLQANVSTGVATAVDGGQVEFSINDRPVGTIGVVDGRAEVEATVGPGQHTARAKFSGTTQLRPSTSEASFYRSR